MIIKEHQLEELNEARRLQKRMSELHIPSPVMSWRYEIMDVSGEIIEKGIGKANSYTRNALNALAYYVGLCDYGICGTSFGDGVLSTKASTGTNIYSLNSSLQESRAASKNPIAIVGISNDAESIDSYATPASGLTAGSNAVTSSFNATSRILSTIISRSFVNNTGSAINVCEAGVILQSSSGFLNLFIRDVFDSISVAPGNSLNWTYTTEVAYPNP